MSCARGANTSLSDAGSARDARTARLEAGTVPTRMYAGGAQCAGRPTMLVHAYNDEDVYIVARMKGVGVIDRERSADADF